MTLSTHTDEFIASLRHRKPSTKAGYRQAITHFLAYSPSLPATRPAQIVLLSAFTEWLREERGLAAQTTRLYAGKVTRWLRWLSQMDTPETQFIPPGFPLEAAIANLKETLGLSAFTQRAGAPAPPEGIERLLAFYGSRAWYEMAMSKTRCKAGSITPAFRAQIKMETLRNRALVRCLADSGGRISEVLSLDVADFPPIAWKTVAETGRYWTVEVEAKAGNTYDLWLCEALGPIAEYIKARGLEPGDQGALFVYHTARHAGQRLNRTSVWRMFSEASRALGIERVSPHDLRHWRASELLNAGVSLDVIQTVLGHVSMETTRKYYAHTDRARVAAGLAATDKAAKNF